MLLDDRNTQQNKNNKICSNEVLTANEGNGNNTMMAENRGGKDKTNCLFGFKLRKTSDNDFICITSVQSFAINIFAFIHVFLDDEKKNNNKMKNSTMKNIETITKENSDSEDSDHFDDTSDSDNRGEVDKINCLFRFCS